MAQLQLMDEFVLDEYIQLLLSDRWINMLTSTLTEISSKCSILQCRATVEGPGSCSGLEIQILNPGMLLGIKALIFRVSAKRMHRQLYHTSGRRATPDTVATTFNVTFLFECLQSSVWSCFRAGTCKTRRVSSKLQVQWTMWDHMPQWLTPTCNCFKIKFYARLTYAPYADSQTEP